MKLARPNEASTKAERQIIDFPLVCVGGATPDIGGYTELIRNLPVDLAAAIVLINHVRTANQALFEALVHNTKIPVETIVDGMRVRPNRVFFLQEGNDLHVLDGSFHLKPVSKPTGWTDVITVFLRSLTEHWHGQIVAVILSGLDGDGAAALRGVKEVGGITIAQKIDTAGDPNMPSSAIASGYVDLILSLEDIAKQIVRIAQARKAESLR
jgi:two-component system chemotaxis response regulator CheB